MLQNQKYDLVVLGAGSGGIATAIEAAKLGAKVALIEENQLGGTCVNVGCVPKKIMWLASELALMQEKAHHFGFSKHTAFLDWNILLQKRENYIKAIHTSYLKRFAQHNIQLFAEKGILVKKNAIEVKNVLLESPHIVLATGGEPKIPNVLGKELGVTSDDFFKLRQCPNRVAIVGAGYIGLELAGMFQAFGARTHIILRHEYPIRNFDPFLSHYAKLFLEQQNIVLHTKFNPIALERQPNGQIRVESDQHAILQDMDCVFWAIGRKPKTQHLNLDALGIQTDADGFLVCDHDNNTSVNGVYAIGDITNKPQLTPVAIRAGRRLAHRLFGKAKLRLDEHLIPSIIFTHPPLATIGLSEQQAHAKYKQVKVYQSEFKPMAEAFMDHPLPFAIKLITAGKEEKVVGLHLAGNHCDEMLQGFAVAMQSGATKQDFDDTIALHPTSSEEIILLR